MKMEDIKIEDAADANYVIRKFFNNEFKDIKMSQLEQLVLAVYNMGKKSGDPAAAAGGEAGSSKAVESGSANPFSLNDRAITIDDIEIAHSGETIKTDTVGTVSSINGDNVSFLFESGEDGEMIETSVPYYLLAKVDD